MLILHEVEKWSTWGIIPTLSVGWGDDYNNMWQCQGGEFNIKLMKLVLLEANWAITFLGPDHVARHATEAEKELQNCHYDCEQKGWDLDKYDALYKKQHMIIESLVDYD